MSCFLLIPGAGGTSWYWSRVVPLLAEHGHEVVAVELPGADPVAGLPEYVAIVTAALADRDDVVVVAASLGGFTAAMVCDRVPVAGLVLVNAMIPLPGETAGDWWADTGAIEARAAAATAGGYGPFAVSTYFLHDVPPDIGAEGAPYQREEAPAAFASPCEFAGWPAIPIRVLAGADDRFFPVEFQRRVARDRLGIEIDVRSGGHLIALAQPALVAQYLLGAVTPSRGSG